MAVPQLNNVWCVEFQSGADWFSPANAGQFEQVYAPYSCPRTWMVVHRDDWSSLIAAAGESTGSGSTFQPSFPLASLTLEQAEQLGWMSLAPIVAAYLARKFRDVLN